MKKYISFLLATMLVAALPFSAFASEEDTQEPNDVENIQVTPYDGAIMVTWDDAYDDTAVTGYKVFYGTSPITGEGQSLDMDVDAGDVLEYVITELENDTEYFVSVIAYDEAGNESINWGTPINASATPNTEAGAPVASGDSEAPLVADAEALNMVEVKIEFSEPVVLPLEDAEDAFSIENDDTFEPLLVISAEMDEEDESGQTVILTTENQDAEVQYTLTVGIDVKDLAGNGIVSGTSDTAAFEGSDEEKEIEEVVADLALASVTVVDNTHVTAKFTKSIELSIDPSEDFIITNKESDETLEILGVELTENDESIEDALVLLTTSPQEAVSYNVTVVNVLDDEGNEIAQENAVAEFRGIPAPVGDTDTTEDPVEDPADTPIEDLVAPEDVAKILVKKLIEAEKYVVKLTWSRVQSANADAVKQTVYKSGDGSDYDKEADLDPEATEYEMRNLEAGEYWFKLTQTDSAGNESEGEIVKVLLSETGPEMAGLLLLSAGFGRIFRKKRK